MMNVIFIVFAALFLAVAVGLLVIVINVVAFESDFRRLSDLPKTLPENGKGSCEGTARELDHG